MPLSRRRFFQTGAIAGAALGASGTSGAAPPAVELGPSLYDSIGVTPIVNCRGTFTIISGSLTLPEVKKAMDEASRHYVQMDELMNAVGQRLAELTKADWGIVTAGCAAALTHATLACIAGTNPERMQRIPKLAGLKNELIIPKHSRNVYDHAVRMPGVDIIEVNSKEELESAINPRTALIMIMASPRADRGPLSTQNICAVAKTRNVPVIVDAAAEILTIPNKHLGLGATMVAYSGGKCLRGPQSAGLLLGRKDLVEAAWFNSAPHHAFGRSLKVGKEEIMGMLTAVEMWTRRDHDAEWKQWESWLDSIHRRVTAVPGVTTEVVQPEDLSNHAPVLRIRWDGAALGITGKELEDVLASGRPRIFVAGSTGVRPDSMASSASIMPYMMQPEDHRIAGDALYAVLTHPPKFEAPRRPQGEPSRIAGNWDVRVTYAVGEASHKLTIVQNGNTLTGYHEGETIGGDLRGAIYGDQAQFRSHQPIQGTSLNYEFTGKVDGNLMSGDVNMGEYGSARWTATRRS
ncbi:MAG TPA: aminotransferase class V-fold PLP-dependent enzyme [Bryobacteraceae bacterium]|nr:aminotransferase class V-fold PLP-dependent enzyme [Bryobacteraceae bacterium]